MTNQEKRQSRFFSGYKKLFVLAALVLSGIAGRGQTYQEARALAFKGEHEKARALCRAILAKDFDSDVAVLMARTYAWDGRYDSARVWTSAVLKRVPANRDALDAASDVEYWDKQYPTAIRYCDEALGKDVNDEHFLLKKARILHSMGSDQQSMELLESLLERHPANAEARSRLSGIRQDHIANRIRVAYTYDFFEKKLNQDPWQLAAISYGRKTAIGTLIGRVNRAERFGQTGYQFEMDAYPGITENNYAYLNAGYSNATIFPQTRFGAEWYHSFPKAFEGSLGMRALYFTGSGTYMLTGSVGKYSGNYWISLRSFVIPSSTGTTASGSLQMRRYFSDPENYVGVRVGYGISPDERSYGDGSSTYLTLKSQSVRFEYNHLFKKAWLLNLAASLANEEYPVTGYALHYTLELAIGKYF